MPSLPSILHAQPYIGPSISRKMKSMYDQYSVSANQAGFSNADFDQECFIPLARRGGVANNTCRNKMHCHFQFTYWGMQGENAYCWMKAMWSRQTSLAWTKGIIRPARYYCGLMSNKGLARDARSIHRDLQGTLAVVLGRCLQRIVMPELKHDRLPSRKGPSAGKTECKTATRCSSTPNYFIWFRCRYCVGRERLQCTVLS